MKRVRVCCAGLVLLLSARTAQATPVDRSTDWPSATAFVGVELAGVAPGPLRLRSDTSFPLRPVLPGTAFGLEAGVRFRPIGFALSYQRTQFIREHLFSNKVYAQLCVQIPLWRLVVVPHLDIGYADIGGDLRAARGVGGKVGAALELPVHRLVSVGVGATLDGAGYSGDDRFLRSIGGTFNFRVGLHL